MQVDFSISINFKYLRIFNRNHLRSTAWNHRAKNEGWNSKVWIDASSNTRAQDARYPDFIARRIIHRPRLYTGWSIVGRKLRKRKLAGVTVTGADVGHVLPRRRRCGSVISNAERGWRKGDGEIRGGFLSRKPRYWNDQPPKAVPRPLHFANYALTMRAPDTPQIPFLSRILASRITCSLRGVIDVRVDSDKLCRSSSPFDLRLSRLLIFFFSFFFDVDFGLSN